MPITCSCFTEMPSGPYQEGAAHLVCLGSYQNSRNPKLS